MEKGILVTNKGHDFSHIKIISPLPGSGKIKGENFSKITTKAVV
jgi:hypothetical protein